MSLWGVKIKMTDPLLQKFQQEGRNFLEFFKQELGGIRSNRPHPALLENLWVESYGSRFLLKQLATIQVSLPNALIVQVWDKNNLANCEKAIQLANLGVNTVIEGNQIRVILPPLSQERREQLFSLVKKKAEETRVKLRNLRDEIIKEIQKLFQEKKISEDEKFYKKEELQKIVDKFNEEIEQLVEIKEKEIFQ